MARRRLRQRKHDPKEKQIERAGASAPAFFQEGFMIQVPTHRLFGTKAAAEYLGIHEQTLRKLTDEGVILSRRLGNRRVYRLEDL
jgi:excisionase family DNA binding protein